MNTFLNIDAIPDKSIGKNKLTEEFQSELAQLSDGDITPITYSELKTLRDNSELIPGQKYRITDYECTTAAANTKSAGHQFDIIIEALDVNVLSEEAKAIQHDGDTYFSDCDLSAWELKYCLDNDTSRFNWASASNINYTGTINPSLHDSENKFITPFKPVYSEYIDVNGTPYSGLIEEDNEFKGDDFVCFADIVDPNGFVKLCLFKTSLEDYEEADLADAYFYCGEAEIDGTVYDKWRKAEGVDYNSEDHPNAVPDGDVNAITREYLNVYFYTEKIVTDVEAVASGMVGKGVIYRMIDEFGNDCPYDFKNILYRVEIEDEMLYVYTFSVINNGIYIDPTTIFEYKMSCTGNVIKPYNIGPANKITLNFIYIADNDGDPANYNGCNTFGNNCHDINILRGSYNSFGNECYYNSFGNDCKSNTFGNNCDHNSFGNDCKSNTFGNNCDHNSFGNDCYNNSFGINCSGNSFGNNCDNNSFGNECYYNSFGNECYYNSFGNDCIDNSFGNECYYNSFGNDCIDNSFRISASNVGSLRNYCSYNIFDNGCSYNTIWNDQTVSNTQQIRYIHVKSGVRGTSSAYNFINITKLQSGNKIDITKDSSGNITQCGGVATNDNIDELFD